MTRRLSWIAAWALGLSLGCTGDPDDGFDLVAETSDAISTVVQVTWTAEAENGALVEVGEDDTYGRTFEATLEDGRYSATLLGLRPSTRYHYRVVEDPDDTAR